MAVGNINFIYWSEILIYIVSLANLKIDVCVSELFFFFTEDDEETKHGEYPEL